MTKIPWELIERGEDAMPRWEILAVEGIDGMGKDKYFVVAQVNRKADAEVIVELVNGLGKKKK